MLPLFSTLPTHSESEPIKLMHHFNEESLTRCFHELDGQKAVGIDGVTKSQYGERLADNIKELISKLKCMSYRPGPVREVRIPKLGKPGAR